MDGSSKTTHQGLLDPGKSEVRDESSRGSLSKGLPATEMHVSHKHLRWITSMPWRLRRRRLSANCVLPFLESTGCFQGGRVEAGPWVILPSAPFTGEETKAQHGDVTARDHTVKWSSWDPGSPVAGLCPPSVSQGQDLGGQAWVWEVTVCQLRGPALSRWAGAPPRLPFSSLMWFQGTLAETDGIEFKDLLGQ